MDVLSSELHSARASVTALPTDFSELGKNIRIWGLELGFQSVGIAGIEHPEAERQLQEWLADGLHGEMAYMSRHGTRRSRPAELVPGTMRVLSARMDYLPESMDAMWMALADPQRAYVARYALGRDYHKLVRARLARLARRIEEVAGPFQWRVFADSAPVLEKPIAQAAGLGWTGKHTNLIHPKTGSWFFLGEIYLDLPLPLDAPWQGNPCGSCTRCIAVCPTGAILAPNRLDARRCISYLTLELSGSIPEEFRPALGNRIAGCDDCQLVCPWNRFARRTTEADFLPRHELDTAPLLALFAWTEEQFLQRMEGSALRRLGHERWLRNIAVALGNAPPSEEIRRALQIRWEHSSPVVREHVRWALERQDQGLKNWAR